MVRKEGTVSGPTGFRLYRLVNLVRLVKVFLSVKLLPKFAGSRVYFVITKNSVHLATVIKKQVDASDTFNFDLTASATTREICHSDFIPQAISSSRTTLFTNSWITLKNQAWLPSYGCHSYLQMCFRHSGWSVPRGNIAQKNRTTFLLCGFGMASVEWLVAKVARQRV